MYLYCLLILFLSLCKFQFYLLIAGVGAGADPAPVLKAFFIQPRGCGVRYLLTVDYYTCESTIFRQGERAGVAGGALRGIGGSAGGSLRPEADRQDRVVDAFRLG